MSNPFFLGKRGKTYGPFTAAQIQEMKASDTLLDYSFLWNPKTSEWVPLDSPPPVPQLPSETSIDDILADLPKKVTTPKSLQRPHLELLSTESKSEQSTKPAQSHTRPQLNEKLNDPFHHEGAALFENIYCFHPAYPDATLREAKLCRIDNDGGLLLLESEDQPFANNSSIQLCILENANSRNEKSHTTRAAIVMSKKTKSGWALHIKWKLPVPQFLSQA